MKNLLRLIFLIGINSINSFGQSNFPIKITIGNEATAIPFTHLLTTPIHPTVQIGTEYFYNIGLRHDFYQTANIGYIFHNHLYQGVYLNTGIGYDYKLPFYLKLKSNLEIGYLHTFVTQDEYQFEDGNYINGSDLGNSRFMPILSLGFGYNIKKKGVVKSEIFIFYKSWIEYPYSPGFINTMAHISFEIGYKFYIN